MIPEELRRKIDSLFMKLEQIAIQYKVNTQIVNNVIEDGKQKTDMLATEKYVKKAENQLRNIEIVLNSIARELEETGKINMQKSESTLENGIHANEENQMMAEVLEKQIKVQVLRIQNEMIEALKYRDLEPKRIIQMQDGIQKTIEPYLLGKNSYLSKELYEVLTIDDERIKKIVINKVKEYADTIEKTAREGKEEDENKKTAHQEYAETLWGGISLEEQSEQAKEREKIAENNEKEQQDKGKVQALPDDVIK